MASPGFDRRGGVYLMLFSFGVASHKWERRFVALRDAINPAATRD